jgi:hypothetical protein
VTNIHCGKGRSKQTVHIKNLRNNEYQELLETMRKSECERSSEMWLLKETSEDTITSTSILLTVATH